MRPSSRKIPPNTSSITPKNTRILPNSAIPKIVLAMPPSYNDGPVLFLSMLSLFRHWLIFVWRNVFMVQDARSQQVADAATNPSYSDHDTQRRGATRIHRNTSDHCSSNRDVSVERRQCSARRGGSSCSLLVFDLRLRLVHSGSVLLHVP